MDHETLVQYGVEKCPICEMPGACHHHHHLDQQKSHPSSPPTPTPSFTIVEDDKVGHQFVAKRDLKATELVLDKEVPVIKVPMWHSSGFISNFGTCLGCSFHIDLEVTTHRCSGCGWPVCEELCEKLPDHAENECKIFARQKFTFPPPPSTTTIEIEKEEAASSLTPWEMHQCILIMRTISLKSRDPVRYQELMKLQSIPTLPPSDPCVVAGQRKIDHEIATLKKYFDFSQLQMSDSDLTKILWINNINSFMSHDFDESGNERYRVDLIYTQACRANNSCQPNCAHTIAPSWPAFLMTIRTAVVVQSGEPLTILYSVESVLSTFQRQIDFRQNFYFTCLCPRCLDPSELGTFSSAFICSECKEISHEEADKGYLLPVDPHLNLYDDDDGLWRCTKCQKTEVASSLPFRSDIQELGVLLGPGSDMDFDLEDVEGVMEFYKGNILHKNHWLIQLAADKIMSIINRTMIMDPEFYVNNFKKYQKLALFRLATVDKFFPGVSYFRALIQLKFSQIITTYLEERPLAAKECGDHGGGGDEVKERNDLFKLCGDMLQECLTFFTLFKNGTPRGEMILESLKNMQCRLDTNKIHFETDSKFQQLTI